MNSPLNVTHKSNLKKDLTKGLPASAVHYSQLCIIFIIRFTIAVLLLQLDLWLTIDPLLDIMAHLILDKAYNGVVVDIIKAYNGLEPGRLSLLVPTFGPELPRHLGNSGSCHKSTDCRDFYSKTLQGINIKQPKAN